MEFIINWKCEGCNDTGCQMQNEGPLKGMTRPCPICSPNYDTYTNKYGTDPEENPLTYIDNDQMAKVTAQDLNRNYIIMPDGSERELIL